MGAKPKFTTVQEGRHKAKRVLSASMKYLRRLPREAQSEDTSTALSSLTQAYRGLAGQVGLSQDQQVTKIMAVRGQVGTALAAVQAARKSLTQAGESASETLLALDNIYNAVMEAKKRVTGCLNTAKLRNFEKHQEAKRNGEVPRFTYSEVDHSDEFLVRLLEQMESLPDRTDYSDDDEPDYYGDPSPEMGAGVPDKAEPVGSYVQKTAARQDTGRGRTTADDLLDHPVVTNLLEAVTNLINAEAEARRASR